MLLTQMIIKQMEILIEEEGRIEYLIKFEDEASETSVTFKVYEVVSWDTDNHEVVETEHYLKGYIKWDGCSHIWFGDEDGYLHFSGRDSFEKHKQVMDAIWEICSKRMRRKSG